ncbi:hypothetical protein NOF04DRAFT_9875 [Fusarium oxysporum II5]|uniref:Apple domain-containing protein n=3 Tax=Fusarium oxysporum species complex TaxID=171631 RepID=N1RLJ1_FUSC4|nr:uncharacterized protein FOIG_11521 [Fusarium odoratissimum NRRL 54006]EMT67433.1 hypothetical protein FOC4_g10005523 [Fusarium odoratissimum]EXL95980.1 hypothetical protein FOIG_11521 [Fusarium odoratissimum NRRL 54006]KAK2123768.1 hypothetical protein NOF04DRAFT_9875 [Fusarium oxysporum II5]TXB95924.1 hypothetical protein FocTR4_00016217 [Fusarium oxysporum f. sp. cubense]
MAPRSLNALIAMALAVAGVHAGPCKPSLASSSIISFSSAFSSAETQSTTETFSTIEVLSSTEAQTTAGVLSSTETLSTADTETTEALSTTTALSTTEEQSTTVFGSTTSAETTTAAATTTTEAGCTVACTHVIQKSGACMIGFQIAPWLIDESWHIGSPTVTDQAGCADACANDCRCKSFASYYTSCDLYSGTQAQINPPSFYLGPYFFDLADCYECDD